MTHPVETKVKAATAAAAVASLLTSILVMQAPGLESTAEPVQAVLIMVLTSVFTWLAGFMAKHTFRSGEPDRRIVPPV